MRAFVAAIVAFLLFGAVAAGAYQAGLASAGAGAPAAMPYGHYGPFGFVYPLLFTFLILGLLSAAFGRSRSGCAHGRDWGGPRMLDAWHRELHERDQSAGKTER